MTGDLTVPNLITSGNVDGRDVSADGSKLDGIETGATADQTASEILTAIKTVDGAGSGLDADLLDGQQGSYYYPASNPNGYTSNTGDITGVTAGTGLTGGGTSGSVTLSHADTSSQASVNNSDSVYIQDITLDTYGHVTGITSTTVPASAPSTAQVLSATAGVSIGEVGSYAWVVSVATNLTTLVPGSTVAGSSIYYGGVSRYSGWAGNSNSVYLDNANESGLNAYNATTLSGTWRIMGNARSYDANRGFGTLAVRIS